MSTNEELAAVIQAGEDRMGELWAQTERFVASRARRVPLEGRADVEFSDLMQSGYLALVTAVETYEPESGAFLTHLGFHLKTAFAEATRFRSERQKRETLAGTLSLDAPLSDDPDAGVLADLVADPTATMETAEETIYRQQLHEAVETVLDELPPQHSQIIRQRFYEEKTLSGIAQEQGTTPERIRQKELSALRELRKPRNAARLRPFFNFDFYHGVGLGAFRQTGMSVQERYLLREEEAQEREAQRRREREARAGAWEVGTPRGGDPP